MFLFNYFCSYDIILVFYKLINICKIKKNSVQKKGFEVVTILCILHYFLKRKVHQMKQLTWNECVTPLIPAGQHTLEGGKGGKKPTFIKGSTMCYTFTFSPQLHNGPVTYYYFF